MPRKGERLLGDIRIHRPALHEGQRAVLEAARQINWLAAGRGWWKSSLMINVAIDALLEMKKVWWTSFTKEPIDLAINELWKPLVFGESVWNECYHEEDRILYLPGFHPMRFGSLQQAARQRGSTPDVVINDEAGLTARGVFISIIRPMIFKSNGVSWNVGTPDPDDPLNDFYEYLTHQNEAEEEGDASRTARFIIPVVGATVTDRGDLLRQPHPYENPHYRFEDLKALWEQTPAGTQRVRLEVEMLCAFRLGGSNQIENAGRVCVLPCVPGKPEYKGEWWLKDFTHHTSANYMAGIDIGLSENPTVLSVGDETTGKMVYFRRFFPDAFKPSSRWRQVREAIARVHDLFPKVDLRVDVTGEGNSIPDDMDEQYGITVEAVNFAGTGEEKIEMMNHLSDVVENQTFQFFALSEIREELSILKRTRTDSGKLQIKAPKTKFDDIPVSVGLMVREVELSQEHSKATEIARHRELLEQALEQERTGYGSVGDLPDLAGTRSGGIGSSLPDWNLGF